jgi:hypothetical protein
MTYTVDSAATFLAKFGLSPLVSTWSFRKTRPSTVISSARSHFWKFVRGYDVCCCEANHGVRILRKSEPAYSRIEIEGVGLPSHHVIQPVHGDSAVFDRSEQVRAI